MDKILLWSPLSHAAMVARDGNVGSPPLLSPCHPCAHSWPDGHLGFSFGVGFVARHQSNVQAKRCPSLSKPWAKLFPSSIQVLSTTIPLPSSSALGKCDHQRICIDLERCCKSSFASKALQMQRASLQRPPRCFFIKHWQQILTLRALLTKASVKAVSGHTGHLSCWSADTSWHSFQTVPKQRLQRWLCS